jgi:hypothetical protein
VARRVEEDDALAVVLDLAGADVLGDPAALAGGDLRRPDRVEQARLAVVDMTHDGDDRGAGLEERRVVLLEQDLADVVRGGAVLLAVLLGRGGRRRGGGRLGHLEAELARDQRGRIAVDQLVDRGEDAALDQLADDVCRVDAEQVGELLDGDRGRQLDRATLTRIEDLDLALLCAVPARRLARPAPAAGAAPTPRHCCLLPPSSSTCSWCSCRSCRCCSCWSFRPRSSRAAPPGCRRRGPAGAGPS